MTKPRTGAGKAPAPKRRGGASGKNLLTEVKLRAEDDEIELWDVAAERSGVDRNKFIRLAANQLAESLMLADVTALSGGRATVRGGRIVRAR